MAEILEREIIDEYLDKNERGFSRSEFEVAVKKLVIFNIKLESALEWLADECDTCNGFDVECEGSEHDALINAEEVLRTVARSFLVTI